WLLLGADNLTKRLALLPQALGVLALAAVKWVVVDALVTRLSGNWSANQYTPVLNPLMGVGAALAGSIVGMYLLRRERVAAIMQESGASDRAGALFVAVAVALLI